MDRVIGDIGRFDADHVLPAIGSHVGHDSGLVCPGIPHDGAGGSALFDDDATVPPRIVYHAGRVRVQV